MEEKDIIISNSTTDLVDTSKKSSLPDKDSLNQEALSIINQIVAESDEQKIKNLTYLFNNNQNKKTLIRVNKLSDLLDSITDQALLRLTAKPDEISNKELLDGLKIIQDLIERGQKQFSGTVDTPLIQVNQQTNEVNIDTKASNLNRASREKVKAAVLGLLGDLQQSATSEIIIAPEDIKIADEGDYENSEC